MRAVGRSGDGLPAAEIDLVLRPGFDTKAGGAKHGFDAGSIGDPPVGLVVGVAVLDEVHLGIAGLVEGSRGVEVVIRFGTYDVAAAALHTLEEHQVSGYVLMDQVKSEERVAEVIKDTHEDDEVEGFAESADIPDGETAELDVDALDLGGEAGLAEVMFVRVDAEDAGGSASLHLQRVETGVAADIKDSLTGEVGGDGVAEARELSLRIVAQEVIGCCLNAFEVQVMKPGAERFDLRPERRFLNGGM
jgi:hypothetical protein